MSKLEKKYANRDKFGEYDYCSALHDLRIHAEETEDVDLYKEMVKKRCELDCVDDCWRHEQAKDTHPRFIKSKFRNRRSISSLLRR